MPAMKKTYENNGVVKVILLRVIPRTSRQNVDLTRYATEACVRGGPFRWSGGGLALGARTAL